MYVESVIKDRKPEHRNQMTYIFLITVQLENIHKYVSMKHEKTLDSNNQLQLLLSVIQQFSFNCS